MLRTNLEPLAIYRPDQPTCKVPNIYYILESQQSIVFCHAGISYKMSLTQQDTIIVHTA